MNLGSELLNYIIENNFEPGDRLPSIAELTEPDHLDMSGSKIREQLEVARALGLVEVRSKIGTRVKEYSFTPAVRLSLLFALACDPQNFEQFADLRNHIETSFWHEACKLLTDDDLAIMNNAINEASSKLNAHPIHIPYAEHRTFHLTVFKHLNNPFVIGLLEAYWDAYEQVEFTRYVEYEYLKNVWEYHAQILQYIEQGDFETAKQAFIEHTKLLRYKLIQE